MSLRRDAFTSAMQYAYDNRQTLYKRYKDGTIMKVYDQMNARRPIQPLYLQGRRRLSSKRPRTSYTPRPSPSLRYSATAARVFGRQAIGEPVGTSIVKTRMNEGGGLLGTRQLAPYSIDLTKIPKGTTESTRERDTINCRGFAIRFNIINLQGASPRPGLTTGDNVLLLNLALISCKNDTLASIPANNFFRAQDNNDDRAIAYSPDLSAEESHNLPINTDEYTVLRHDRETLNYQAGGIDGFSKSFNYYVPLNRQLTFRSDGEAFCNNKIFLVWWIDTVMADGGSAAVTNCARCQYRALTYFRDTLP